MLSAAKHPKKLCQVYSVLPTNCPKSLCHQRLAGMVIFRFAYVVGLFQGSKTAKMDTNGYKNRRAATQRPPILRTEAIAAGENLAAWLRCGVLVRRSP
jgi:hypothetical protein